MKETGIIMSRDHPQKVLDGSKTKTRRTAGLNKINKNPDMWELSTTVEEWEGKLDNVAAVFFPVGKHNEGWAEVAFCPYGQVGDRLWVRETWQNYADWNGDHLYYRADGKETFTKAGKDIKIYWKPSIHMFKKYARIWLEITEVRVERVQEISEGDIRKEGHQPFVYPVGAGKDVEGMRELGSAQTFQWFMGLWDSLNAKRGYGWELNPYVWVISFRQLELIGK